MENSRKFLFKLCLELNYKSVSELEHTMSTKELSEWSDYFSEEPFSSRVNEIQLATLTEILLKSFNNKSDLTALDFMISISKEDKDIRKKEIKKTELFEKLNKFGS